jgi:hypothetical protein
VSDISEARQKIRDLVTPLKRKLYSYHIEEHLGNGFKEWDDDSVRITIKIDVTPAMDYPLVQYESSCFNLVETFSTDRADAIAQVHDKVEAMCPKWRRAIEIDEAFSKTVGRQVRMLKTESEFIINQDEERRQQGTFTREMFRIEAGTILDVVEHEPGRLTVQLGERKFYLYFWRFVSYMTKCDPQNLQDPGVRIPDPHVEFTDGYTPWVLGVEERV